MTQVPHAERKSERERLLKLAKSKLRRNLSKLKEEIGVAEGREKRTSRRKRIRRKNTRMVLPNETEKKVNDLDLMTSLKLLKEDSTFRRASKHSSLSNITDPPKPSSNASRNASFVATIPSVYKYIFF